MGSRSSSQLNDKGITRNTSPNQSPFDKNSIFAIIFSVKLK